MNKYTIKGEYDSPIQIIQNRASQEAASGLDEAIRNKLDEYDIRIDEKALLEMINGERNQWEEGFKAGKRDAYLEIKAFIEGHLNESQGGCQDGVCGIDWGE